MKRVLFTNLLTLSLGLFAFTARADVKPHALCSDGMVLQQQADVKLWGTADPGEKVTVLFRGQEATAITDTGSNWVVTVASGEAGGPFELTIAGKNTLTYKNVLVGEVWLCAGQSNMCWVFGQCDETDKAFANTAPSNSMLRLSDTAKGARVWVEAKPATIYPFSAVAYSFGRYLQEARKVPVGLIRVPFCPVIQDWMSASALEPFEKPKTNSPPSFYYGWIQPMLNYRLRGVIWYQGENAASSGVEAAFKYRYLLPTMINSWRAEFQNPDLAFHIVQLATIGNGPAPRPGVPAVDGGDSSTWALVREAQTLTALMLKNTGLVVITDFGGNLHPTPKRPVGERLALAARGLTYGEKIVYSGPMLKSLTFDGAKAILGFAHVGGGLVAKEVVLTPKADGNGDAYRVKEGSTSNVPLDGFIMCGKDKVYHWAQAEIVGDTVVVTSSNVVAPTAVRYGFTDNPVCNLYNREGLPASPFRTDQLVAALKLSAGAGGAVSPSNALLLKGMAIPIRATPPPNDVFAGWTVISGAAEFANPKAAETTVRITDDSAIQASFAFVVSCAITAPVNPTLVKAGSKVKLAATASILQGNSTVRKVEFFREDVKIGEAAANPYAFTWSDVQTGSHAVTARATDSTGLVATSAPVYVVATASGAWEGIHATGGTVAYYTEGGTNWTAHVFTNSGVLNVKAAGEVEYLVVGGGGGGGGTYESGGGGAGGVRTGTMTLPAGTYTITVGNGGNGSLQGGLPASNGGPSSLSNGLVAVKALGGGYGGSSAGYGGGEAGDGGSGGGGMWSAKVPGKAVGGVGELGHDGGLANAASGGGGAGGVGQNAGPAAVRDGGPGWVSTLRDGSIVVTYASGGVGRARSGNNLFAFAVVVRSKADNTGDGGDGGSSGSSAKGGNGGSGIVIVRYVTGGK